MAWAATANVERYDDAVEWFKNRFPVTPALLSKLRGYGAARAWTIAGVAQLDIVLQTHESIVRAIEKGTPLGDWKKQIEDVLTGAWGRRNSPRVNLIFRNATQQAYVAGRMRQLRDPDVLKLRPFWRFDGIRDQRQSTVCKECNGTILPADDPWWNTHTPQLHHACRSKIDALRAKTAKEKGITEDPPRAAPDQGFGAPPDLGQPWEPAAKDYPKALWQAYQQKQTATEGVHFKNLRSNASHADRQAALAALSENGLLPFLEKEPLQELRLNKSSGVRGAVGWYSRSDQTLAVGLKRPPWTVGQPFKPGSVWSISSAGETEREAVKRTLIHEVGHHIHRTSTPEVDQIIRDAFTKGRDSAITQYAKETYPEYFAESFAAYKFHRTELLEQDPGGFEMVEKVLRLRGVIP